MATQVRIIRKTLIALYTEPRSASRSVNGQNRLGIPDVIPALQLRLGQALAGIQFSPPGFRVAACGPVSSTGQARSERGASASGWDGSRILFLSGKPETKVVDLSMQLTDLPNHLFNREWAFESHCQKSFLSRP